MPLKEKKARAEYHRKYDKIHRKDINKMQRIRRAKKKRDLKISDAKFDYELGIFPLRMENRRVENKNGNR